jgi:hypothetical protein
VHNGVGCQSELLFHIPPAIGSDMGYFTPFDNRNAIPCTFSRFINCNASASIADVSKSLDIFHEISQLKGDKKTIKGIIRP